MNLHFSRFWISSLGCLVIANSMILAADATENNEVTKQLNNLLPIKVKPEVYLTKTISQSGTKSSQREYLFKAPDNKIISNPQQLTRNQGYRVEVFGSADELLKQVKDIEPKAFRKGDIIQVGIFSEQKNAEILIRKLAVAGFWSRIVPQ